MTEQQAAFKGKICNWGSSRRKMMIIQERKRNKWIGDDVSIIESARNLNRWICMAGQIRGTGRVQDCWSKTFWEGYKHGRELCRRSLNTKRVQMWQSSYRQMELEVTWAEVPREEWNKIHCVVLEAFTYRTHRMRTASTSVWDSGNSALESQVKVLVKAQILVRKIIKGGMHASIVSLHKPAISSCL